MCKNSEEDELKSIFEANKSPQRIIELLSMIGGEKIEPGKTLIINVRKNQSIEEIFHSRLTEAYNYYLIIGGMPECVAGFSGYVESGLQCV